VSKRQPPAPVGYVIGQNAQRLRGDHKIDDLAKAVTAHGLQWGGGRISDLEAGRVVPRLETLYVLCRAFSDLLGREVGLDDLLAGHGEVIITGDRAAPLPVLRDWLAGGPPALPEPISPEQLLRDFLAEHPDFGARFPPRRRQPLLWKIWHDYGEAEDRAARALGVDKGRLVNAMADRWGKSLTAERDQRAGPGASAQKRGQITRALRDELRKAITDGDH
jgi:hypothetical protein